MIRFRRRALRAVTLALLAFACVPIEDNRKRDAAPPAPDGQVATPDAQTAPRSCRDIRNCVQDCGENAACASACVSTAPGVARQQFNEAQMCSLGVCEAQDIECRCREECYEGGTCYQIVEECDEAASDKFCDGPCH